ncbi:uncharacterized protein METZ01_LOCUS287087, partial [marine metagenome]
MRIKMKMISKLLIILLSGLILAQDADKKDLEVGDEAP